MTSRHNLTFSGAGQDNRITYRLSAGRLAQEGVVPNSGCW